PERVLPVRLSPARQPPPQPFRPLCDALRQVARAGAGPPADAVLLAQVLDADCWLHRPFLSFLRSRPRSRAPPCGSTRSPPAAAPRSPPPTPPGCTCPAAGPAPTGGSCPPARKRGSAAATVAPATPAPLRRGRLSAWRTSTTAP